MIARRAIRHLTRPAFLLTLGFAALYLATFDSVTGSPDERTRLDLAFKLAREGLGAFVGSGGVSRYPPLLSLLAAPLVKLGLWMGSEWPFRLAHSVSLLSCIALVPLFYRAARLLQVPARRALVAAALFGITNPVWPYSKRFFSEPLSAALILGTFVGVLAWWRSKDRVGFALGLLCFALLPLNNLVLPATLGASLGLAMLFRRDWDGLGWLVAACAVGALLALFAARLQFGAFVLSGYSNERFTFDTLEGLRGLLLGWGRSIFLFAPLLILSMLGLPALLRREFDAGLALVATLLLSLLVIASWWAWYGGVCWGPRLLLPILPMCSIGAALFVEACGEGRRAWRGWVAAPVVLFGLYVQVMGFSFKHDFDIYFWMKSGPQNDERDAWFKWDRSVLRRMPHHFVERPWDLSSAFLTLRQRGPSTVTLGEQPVRRIKIIQQGAALIYHWSIADIFAVQRTEEGGERRVALGDLGASIETFNRKEGAGALDGDPATRWSSGYKRQDGQWVIVDLGNSHTDLLRLELEHHPYDHDFPNGLEAEVQGEGSTWRPVGAHAATPDLVWSPWLGLFALSGVGLAGLSLRSRREP